MALDPKARQITLTYAGGYIEMTRGLAEAVFGADNPALEVTPIDLTVAVKSHTRTRVIGGPSTTVGAYQYTYKKFPTSSNDPASGGREVFVDIGDGEKWSARVGGSFADAATFFKDNAQAAQVFFQSLAGTKYGPFFNTQS
jgi:hypothetical protein